MLPMMRLRGGKGVIVKRLVIDQGGGRLGNQMMQLMTAMTMFKAKSDFEIYGYDMPGWQLSRPIVQGVPYCPLLLRGRVAPFGLARRLCQLGLVNSILMRSVCVDHRWFLPRDEAQALFRPRPEEDAPGFGDEYILIHVRGEDILFGKHGDYGPVPFGYYKSILKETGKKPVFLGQMFDDYYSNMIRSEFPDAVYLPRSTVIGDFQIIRNSKNIILSHSTFCWLAAWLSNAEHVYMPLIGGWNPEQRPDGNLTPADDPRFVYDLFPQRIWRGTPEQIAGLASESDFRRVTGDEVNQIRDQASRKLIPKRLRKASQLFLYLLMHLAGRAIA